MKNFTNIRKSLLTLTTLLLTAIMITVLGSNSASARERYKFVSGEVTTTSTTPIFNAFYDVPGIGDEENFVGLRTSTGDPRFSAATNPYASNLTAACEIGSKYDVRSYIHNSASNLYNNDGAGTAIAHNAKITMTAPLGTKGTSFTFTSTISASNAESLSDSGVLDCGNRQVQLKLVASTVYSRRNIDPWESRPDSAVNGTMPIGSRVQNSGDVWACWDERVYVVYTVVVEEVPEVPTPEFTCDNLTILHLNDRKYRYTVTATGKNGATVKEYRYNYGDNTGVVVNTANMTEHTYAADGTYKPSVEVVFNVPNAEGQMELKTVTSDKCKGEIKISPEMCPVPGKGNLPKNDPACKPDVVVEKCTIPGKTNLPKNDPNCKEEVKGVTTLPNTGAGSIAGLMVGVTAAGTALHRRFTLKRNK